MNAKTNFIAREITIAYAINVERKHYEISKRHRQKIMGQDGGVCRKLEMDSANAVFCGCDMYCSYDG